MGVRDVRSVLRRWKIEESASSPVSIASRTRLESQLAPAPFGRECDDLFALSGNFAKSVKRYEGNWFTCDFGDISSISGGIGKSKHASG
jgi:hypothetical protein